MKGLTKYIKEELEITPSGDGDKNYRTVSLVHRDIDGKSISKEDFVKSLSEDFHKAISEYDKVIKPYNDEQIERFKQAEIDYAIKYAKKKWKDKTSRDEYVDNVRKNSVGDHFMPEKITFFDVNPTRNISMDGVITLSVSDGDKSISTNCGVVYDKLKENGLLGKLDGWSFKYEADAKSLRSCFRPYVDLGYDDDTRSEIKKNKENLDRSIDDFYKNTEYWGD